MNEDLLNFIKNFCAENSLQCNICDETSRCKLKHFIQYVNQIGIDDFSYKLIHNSLDSSILSIYKRIERNYPYLKSESINSICGLCKDGHF